MKEQDIDKDGEKELLVVLHNVTGSGTGEDELHVLETKNKSGFEAYHVPMDSFWNWGISQSTSYGTKKVCR